MLAAAATKIAALTAVAALAVAAPAFAAHKGHHVAAASFGNATHYVTSLDTDVESGTMHKVPCARGHQPGATCYLAR